MTVILEKILKFALFTKLDSNENNDHIFSVFKSLDKHQLDYDVDSQSFDLISKLDNNSINNGSRGEITKQLQEKFQEIISGHDKFYQSWLTFTK